MSEGRRWTPNPRGRFTSTARVLATGTLTPQPLPRGPSWSSKAICRTAEAPAKSCMRKPGPCSPIQERPASSEQRLARTTPPSCPPFAQALRWLLLQASDASALIRADSIYAGNLADGSWKAKANRALVARVQALWMEVKEQRDVAWDHVRAHRGHRWNERADHLAGRHALGEAPDPLSFWRTGNR